MCESYYKDVTKLIEQLLKIGLKDNQYIKYSILTGIMNVSNSDLFSGLNNFDEFSVLKDKFS